MCWHVLWSQLTETHSFRRIVLPFIKVIWSDNCEWQVLHNTLLSSIYHDGVQFEIDLLENHIMVNITKAGVFPKGFDYRLFFHHINRPEKLHHTQKPKLNWMVLDLLLDYHWNTLKWLLDFLYLFDYLLIPFSLFLLGLFFRVLFILWFVVMRY